MAPRRAAAVLAVACALVALRFSPVAQATRAERLTFTVLEQTRECLYKEIEAGFRVKAMATVVHGGKLDIGLVVTSPSRATLYDRVLFSNVDDGTGNLMMGVVPKGHEFDADETGLYEFCLNNKMARWTGKRVLFELEVKLPRSEGGGTDPNDTPTDRMAATVRRLHEALDVVDADQQHLRAREEVHRDTAESSQERVTWFTLLETAVYLTLSVGQVGVVKGWFKSRPTSGLTV
mmetsp:Transcript_15013/g.52215  ORF Transcript_15013/g.52215 Transcript_15013/m.52215 type:complete len:234 (-) Transcript_15013:356-1057(-)